MKIAQISTMVFDTPPKDGGYGGTELVVSLLTEQLVNLGHEVVLFATGNSKTKAKLWYWYEQSIPERVYTNYEILHVSKAYEYIRTHKFDIIHNHTYSMGPALLNLVKHPSLTTVHLPVEQIVALYSALQNHRFVAISNRQQELAPEVNWLETVYNGIEVSDFKYNVAKEDYLLFLSTVSPWKGTHIAVRVAQMLGRRLKIAGSIYDQEWFEREIAPHIDNKTIEYIGPVNFAQKVELYSKAAALLFPISWEEPFGLVTIEALACGTPVIAFAHGAAPEIIRTNEVGFLVENVEEMAEAVGKVSQISPEKCRSYVDDNFSSRLMTERYIKLYKMLINK